MLRRRENHSPAITINQSQSITPPVDVVGDERNVEKEREPLPGNQKQNVEQQVKKVFRQHLNVFDLRQ